MSKINGPGPKNTVALSEIKEQPSKALTQVPQEDDWAQASEHLHQAGHKLVSASYHTTHALGRAGAGALTTVGASASVAVAAYVGATGVAMQGMESAYKAGVWATKNVASGLASIAGYESKENETVDTEDESFSERYYLSVARAQMKQGVKAAKYVTQAYKDAVKHALLGAESLLQATYHGAAAVGNAAEALVDDAQWDKK